MKIRKGKSLRRYLNRFAGVLISLVTATTLFALNWPVNFQDGEIINAQDINARLNDLDERITALKAYEQSVIGQVAAFSGACPTGWQEDVTAKGRVIVGKFSESSPLRGDALSVASPAVSITDVPAHTHSMDNAGAHTHTLPGATGMGGARCNCLIALKRIKISMLVVLLQVHISILSIQRDHHL